MANKRIDAFIEKHNKEYHLYLHYNNLDFVFLYKDPEAEEFAIEFKWKYLVSNPPAFNHTFTDNRGWVKEKRDYKSLIASIKGIEHIDDAIANLVSTSLNLDIQSDLIFHLNEKEYEVVKDVDNEEYFAADTLKVSKKGISKDELHSLASDIKLLIDEDNKQSAY